MPGLYTPKIEAEAHRIASLFCTGRCKDNGTSAGQVEKWQPINLPNDLSPPLFTACVINVFIKLYTHYELSAFFDANKWAERGLQAISFLMCPDVAIELVATLINSEHYTAFKMLIMPKRERGLTNASANQLPATQRTAFVQTCLQMMTKASVKHTVPNLINYLDDTDWYRCRGSVPDGCRPWKLWRHITNPETPISDEIRYMAIRALLSTCPGPLCMKGAETPLSKRADAEAVRILLNPPCVERIDEGIRLARKVGVMHINAAAIMPAKQTALLCYQQLSSRLAIETIKSPAFRWHPEHERQGASEFMLLLAQQDHRNGCLLPIAPDLSVNRNELVKYCDLIGQFQQLSHHGTGSDTDPLWNICTRGVRDTKTTALIFATCAFVGIFKQNEQNTSMFQAIDTFFSFSKRVSFGHSKNTTLWSLLWQPHLAGGCLAEYIGSENALRGTWIYDVCSPDAFKIFQNVARVFATNPYLDVARRALFSSLHPELSLGVCQIKVIRAITTLHQRHPNIGPQKGYYERPTHEVQFWSHKQKNLKGARSYVREWILPNFHDIARSSKAGKRGVLAHRVSKRRKDQIATWFMAQQRSSQKKSRKKTPYLCTEIQQTIIAMCI